MTDVKIKRALLSVSDKTGLAELGQALARHGVELVSTGGTAKALRDAGLEVRDVSDLTGFPEMMDGRVKTLHPKVHGGLLARARQCRACGRDGGARHRRDRSGRRQPLSVRGRPSRAAPARDEIIENIDIGGPSMVRSAAKNHAFVAIVTDPADYAELIAALDANGGTTSLDLRKRLAAKAFAATAAYDAMIASWFAFADQGERFPDDAAADPEARRRAALRREPAPAGGALPPSRPGGARHRPGRAGAGQGAELQQSTTMPTRRSSWSPSSATRAPTVRHRQARQSLRRRHRRRRWPRPIDAAFACDTVSAFGGIIARQPPARRRDRRGDRRRSSPKSSSRPTPTTTRARSSRAKKNLRLLLTGELPDPARGGLDAASRSPAACWSSRATMAGLRATISRS